MKSRTALMHLIAFFLYANINFASAGDNHWQAWDEILQATVSADGFVDYDAIAATNGIDAIVDVIANTDIESLTSKTQQLVFYINSYNVLVIKSILNGKSPSNIFSRISFFKRQEYSIGGKSMTLNDLEHGVIRPLNEPRIHFALVCAALSCPKLLNTIFTEEQLDQQLETLTHQFVNNTDRNHFDHNERVIYLSKIFDWFGEDFELNERSKLEFIADYVSDSTLANELRNNEYKIEYNDYYWSLNGRFED